MGTGIKKTVVTAFNQQFGGNPAFMARAPGRVNLIGEHTDYNDGFVLPMAIDRAVWIALRPRPDRQVILHALDLAETDGFNLNNFQRSNKVGWIEYVKGVAWALQEKSYTLTGWEGVVAGDVPVGAGLSSSAALELAATRAFTATADLPWEPTDMAKVGQRAENEWVGMNCGIMDQLISAAGVAGHALLIDCRSLETQTIPLPKETAIVILDTGSRRGLVDSAYNERRAQCETAARFFGVSALRDVDLSRYQYQADQLDNVTRRRARHVITENARVLQATEAMRQNDPTRLGQLMNDSHTSLRDDFEVSNDALNTIVDCARQQIGCYGARMTGAGFGGCAVALVQTDAVERFAAVVSRDYKAVTDLTPAIYVCAASNGAEITFYFPQPIVPTKTGLAPAKNRTIV